MLCRGGFPALIAENQKWPILQYKNGFFLLLSKYPSKAERYPTTKLFTYKKVRTKVRTMSANFEAMIGEFYFLNPDDRLSSLQMYVDTYYTREWMLKQKLRIFLALQQFDSEELLECVIMNFVNARCRTLDYIVNFIRCTPSLQKSKCLIEQIERFSSVPWSREAYLRNPQHLFLALKKNKSMKLIQYAKDCVRMDARNATFFKLFTDEEVKLLNTGTVFRSMEERDELFRFHITLHLTLRGIYNVITIGKRSYGGYCGCKYFGYPSDTPALGVQSYGMRICQYLSPAYDYSSFSNLVPKTLPPPQYGMLSTYYPKEPLKFVMKPSKKKAR
jgi:hypothetical protein